MWTQSRFALEFFRNYNVPFWQMSSDNSFRVPAGSGDRVLSSTDGTTIVVHRRDNTGGSISMGGLTGGYSVQWYNPRTGGSLQNGSVTSIQGGGLNVPYGSPPDTPDNDWVILIKGI
jgi:Putative collagen-binding domain of a collagenase